MTTTPQPRRRWQWFAWTTIVVLAALAFIGASVNSASGHVVTDTAPTATVTAPIPPTVPPGYQPAPGRGVAER